MPYWKILDLPLATYVILHRMLSLLISLFPSGGLTNVWQIIAIFILARTQRLFSCQKNETFVSLKSDLFQHTWLLILQFTMKSKTLHKLAFRVCILALHGCNMNVSEMKGIWWTGKGLNWNDWISSFCLLNTYYKSIVSIIVTNR